MTCDTIRWWFSPSTPVSSTNKTDHYNITNVVESGVKHHKPNPQNYVSPTKSNHTVLGSYC